MSNTLTENELRKLLGDTENCEVFMDLSRKTMGMTVNVSYAKKEDIYLLEAETNAAHKIVVISPDEIVHAFYHPSIYVANPSELFPKSKSL